LDDRLPLSLGLTEEDERFFHSLGSEDDVGVILRVHLHCERILKRLLEKHASNPETLGKVRLAFMGRVYLLHAFGLIDGNTVSRMHWLDSIRNELSHQIDRELSEADYLRLLDASGPQSRDTILSTNSLEKSANPGALIRNALFFWRNNLKAAADRASVPAAGP